MVDDFIRISIDRVSQQFLSYSVSNLTLNLLHKNLSHDKQVVAKVDNTLSLLHREFQSFFPFLQAKTHTHTLLHTQTFFMVPIMSEVELFPFCCLGQCRYYIYLSHSGQEILQIMPIKEIKILQKLFTMLEKLLTKQRNPS